MRAIDQPKEAIIKRRELVLRLNPIADKQQITTTEEVDEVEQIEERVAYVTHFIAPLIRRIAVAICAVIVVKAVSDIAVANLTPFEEPVE